MTQISQIIFISCLDHAWRNYTFCFRACRLLWRECVSNVYETFRKRGTCDDNRFPAHFLSDFYLACQLLRPSLGFSLRAYSQARQDWYTFDMRHPFWCQRIANACLCRVWQVCSSWHAVCYLTSIEFLLSVAFFMHSSYLDLLISRRGAWNCQVLSVDGHQVTRYFSSCRLSVNVSDCFGFVTQCVQCVFK